MSNDNTDGDDLSLPLVTGSDELMMSGETTSAAGPFYDGEVVLEITKSIATGYFILITGGSMTVPATNKKASNKRRLSLKQRKKTGVSPPPAIVGKLKSHDGQDGIEVRKGDDDYDDDCDEGITMPASPSSALNTTINTSLDDAVSALQDELPEHLSISWLSIINGNIIDSCFGVKANGGLRYTPMVLKHGGSKQWEKDSVGRVKSAKEQLSCAAEAHPAIKLLAIEAYGRCMQIIVSYHNDMEGLGALSPLLCHRVKSIRCKALRRVQEEFEHLAGAVEATL